ncbi:hypothetical protein [Neolewinella antarctica]|uniref:Outer membrane protein beta-barrel domain-containing protein n=1 Tax=Neolewinella antarctica TaxID=442734 RepID=A0ABX0X771_9BACT|nr:hypothetical protein [Neolewinella antarctica]NJC25060.1 hypothetical protein [Neolewinella antarctica]
MQDNNWTDDEQFYDEAWAGMSKRLDQRQRNNRPLFWLLGLLLAVAALGGGYFLWPHEQPTANRVISVIPAEGKEKFAGQGENLARSRVQGDSPNADGAGIEKLIPKTTEKTGNESNRRAALLRTAERFAPLLNAPVTIGKPVQVTRESSNLTPQVAPVSLLPFTQIVSELPATSSPTGVISSDTSTVVPDPVIIREENAVSPLPFASQLRPVERTSENTFFPSIIVRKSRKPALFLEATALSGTDAQTPGYSLGAGASFRLGNRFSLPVVLRYRSDRRAIKSFGEPISDNLATPGPGVVVNNTSQELLSNLRLSNLDVVRTNSVEVVAGLDYRIRPRWSVSGSLGGSYLTSFRGTRVLTSTGNTVLDFAFSEGFNNVQLNPPTGTPGPSVPVQPYTADVRRWLIHASLGVNYHANDRLRVSVNARNNLSPLVEDNGVNFSRLQFGLGVRYDL